MSFQRRIYALIRSEDSERITSKQKNGKFRFSSPRIDMGTAITPLESYEFTGFSRIGTMTIGTLPEFHDFFYPPSGIIVEYLVFPCQIHSRFQDDGNGMLWPSIQSL